MTTIAEPQAKPQVLGLTAEFAEAEELLAATRAATHAGYKHLEAYAPFPVEGLAEALGFHRTRLPMLVLLGGVLGGVAGFGLQYWASVIHYPMNIGGRPLNSWPLFMPVTFECVVLGSSLMCVLGMLALNGLPRPNHPMFDVKGFEQASTDRFFLVLSARSPNFEEDDARKFLAAQNPLRISEVPHVES